MFELTVIFKHEMIGIWQRFQRNFELSVRLIKPMDLSYVSSSVLFFSSFTVVVD